MSSIQNMYVVFDRKSESYSPPFYGKTDGVATRIFFDLIRDIGSEFKDDFTLHSIGTFDTDSAEIIVKPAKLVRFDKSVETITEKVKEIGQ